MTDNPHLVTSEDYRKTYGKICKSGSAKILTDENREVIV